MTSTHLLTATQRAVKLCASFRNSARLFTLAASVLAASLLLVADPARADDNTYTIQIGAFKSPNEGYAANARAVGTLYSTTRDNGVVALSVGRFATTSAASDALDRISDHYPDAFVRRSDSGASRQDPNAPAQAKAAATLSPTSNTPTSAAPEVSSEGALLATLSDEEREHVVFLDGKLHYKSGNQFVPLAEYRAQNQ